jgi:hypothetical protein
VAIMTGATRGELEQALVKEGPPAELPEETHDPDRLEP